MRARIAWEQIKGDFKNSNGAPVALPRIEADTGPDSDEEPQAAETAARRQEKPEQRSSGSSDLKSLKPMADEIVGTRGAFMLDEKFGVIGRVPVKELEETLKNLDGVHTIIMDGTVDSRLAKTAEDKDVKYIIAPSSTAKPRRTKVLTPDSL